MAIRPIRGTMAIVPYRRLFYCGAACFINHRAVFYVSAQTSVFTAELRSIYSTFIVTINSKVRILETRVWIVRIMDHSTKHIKPMDCFPPRDPRGRNDKQCAEAIRPAARHCEPSQDGAAIQKERPLQYTTPGTEKPWIASLRSQ